MRVLSVRLLVILIVCAGFSAKAATVVAVKTGPWVMSDTWSCKCMPKRTDSIIIPQGIIVSVTHPLSLAPSKDGKSMVISVAGVLNISSASIYIDPIDRILIMPGGKISTKSNGGMIFSGIYALYFEGGTTARGPATLGDGYSPTAIADITAEKDSDGVTVSWRSGSEIDVNYYFVLRSTDGITYDPVAKVDGRGSRKEKLYSFVDEKHPSGLVHYRVDLTDTHGVGAVAATIDVAIGDQEIAAPQAAEDTPRHK